MLFLIWIELELQNIVLAGDLCFSKILCDYFALARQPSKKALDYVGALLKPVIDIFICVFFRKILELVDIWSDCWTQNMEKSGAS